MMGSLPSRGRHPPSVGIRCTPTALLSAVTLLSPPHHVQRDRPHNTPRKVRAFSANISADSDTCCSGTSGYVVRNLSTLRSYQHSNQQDRDAAWDAAPPKHREPDQGILEHERKRAVEVKCLELQVKLEDDEYVLHDISL